MKYSILCCILVTLVLKHSLSSNYRKTVTNANLLLSSSSTNKRNTVGGRTRYPNTIEVLNYVRKDLPTTEKKDRLQLLDKLQAKSYGGACEGNEELKKVLYARPLLMVLIVWWAWSRSAAATAESFSR